MCSSTGHIGPKRSRNWLLGHPVPLWVRDIPHSRSPFSVSSDAHNPIQSGEGQICSVRVSPPPLPAILVLTFSLSQDINSHPTLMSARSWLRVSLQDKTQGVRHRLWNELQPVFMARAPHRRRGTTVQPKVPATGQEEQGFDTGELLQTQVPWVLHSFPKTDPPCTICFIFAFALIRCFPDLGVTFQHFLDSIFSCDPH